MDRLKAIEESINNKLSTVNKFTDEDIQEFFTLLKAENDTLREELSKALQSQNIISPTATTQANDMDVEFITQSKRGKKKELTKTLKKTTKFIPRTNTALSK